MLAEKDLPQIVPNGGSRAIKIYGRESNRVVLDYYIFLNPLVNRRVQKQARRTLPRRGTTLLRAKVSIHLVEVPALETGFIKTARCDD